MVLRRVVEGSTLTRATRAVRNSHSMQQVACTCIDVATMALSRCRHASGKALFPYNEPRFPLMAPVPQEFLFSQHPWIHYLDIQEFQTSMDAVTILHPLDVARAFHG